MTVTPEVQKKRKRETVLDSEAATDTNSSTTSETVLFMIGGRVERVKHSGTLKHEWSGVSDTEDVSKHRMFHETSLKLHVFLAIPGLSDHESRCAGL